jgi:hypothetical protein
MVHLLALNQLNSQKADNTHKADAGWHFCDGFKQVRSWGLKRNELLVLAALLVGATLLPLFFHWLENDYANRKYDQPARSRPVLNGDYEPELISNRLIEFDRLSGIASAERASLAFGNAQAWLSEVKRQCNTTLSNQDYLTCANQLLGLHFYYSPVQAVSEGWANHYSDCDLNVYLLMDAMHMAGREAEIVYAPHHAFIAYKDEITHEPLYWETTTNHNTGAPADLREDFYQKTPSHFYYTPEPASYAESLYPVLVTSKIASPTRRRALLVSLHQRFPDNPVIQDVWYEQKQSITREDAQWLVSLLKTDITSVSKRLLLVSYFHSHNEEDKAQKLLSEISDGNCNQACLQQKSQRSELYHFAQWGITQLKNLDIRVSLNEFFKIISDTVTLYAFILLPFGIYKAYRKWPITVSRKRSCSLSQHPEPPAG